jgi:hypothetical protein
VTRTLAPVRAPQARSHQCTGATVPIHDRYRIQYTRAYHGGSRSVSPCRRITPVCVRARRVTRTGDGCSGAFFAKPQYYTKRGDITRRLSAAATVDATAAADTRRPGCARAKFRTLR